ncbi:amidohydrolase, partial [Klebsiella oxytoca]
SLRRTFHQHPELGREEYETAKRIEAELDAMGIPHSRLGGTGVIGLIQGTRPGRTVALRADMDALPVQEETGAPYASRTPG